MVDLTDSDITCFKKAYKGEVKEQDLLSRIEANEIIYNAILDAIPFWAGRWGQTELNMVTSVFEHKCYWYKDNRRQALKQMCNNAGFFPQSLSIVEKYVSNALECYQDMDIEGCWKLFMSSYFREKYSPNVKKTTLSSLEPFKLYKEPEYRGHPWSYALKGKRVLVVHPFTESIKKQYINRDRIFEKYYQKDEILPEFELKTVKAVQTIAGNKDPRFNDWFEALEWMKEEIDKTEFDVAIIGCGAYGFLLSAHVKKKGKTAIHLGGATQLLFGILGERWIQDKEMMNTLVNDYWIRPIEKPNNIMKVENGCYW